jgi:hypothetical protein
MIWVKLIAAIIFLVIIGMSLAFILVLQDEAKTHYLTESASYAHLPTKGKGK